VTRGARVAAQRSLKHLRRVVFRHRRASLHDQIRVVTITSGQSHLTTGSIAAAHMDGSVVFARLRQCAPHLIHASLAHPNPNLKRHLDIGSAVLHSSQQSVPILYNGPPLKLVPYFGGSRPHLIDLHGSFGPPESSTQTTSRSVQPFLQGSLV